MLKSLIREVWRSIVGIILLGILICLGIAIGMSILLALMGG